MSDAEDRITELEMKLTYAEDQIDALNQTVYKQQQALDKLAEAVLELREQGRNQAQGGGSGAGNFDPSFERPPHY